MKRDSLENLCVHRNNQTKIEPRALCASTSNKEADIANTGEWTYERTLLTNICLDDMKSNDAILSCMHYGSLFSMGTFHFYVKFSLEIICNLILDINLI